MTEPSYPTSIGHSDAESITVLGHDLAGELIGRASFGVLAARLLGGGSRLLGVTEDCDRFLASSLAGHDGALPADDAKGCARAEFGSAAARRRSPRLQDSAIRCTRTATRAHR